MKQNRMAFMVAALLLVVCCASTALSAEPKKGLLVYDSIYSSTPEVAYWLKAIIGNEQPLDVKKIDQVITVKPYDYVIIGSYSKWEKASPRIYKFIEKNQMELAQKQVCYFLLGGDWDETMLLKAPGAPIKLIAGRNYLFDIKEKFPEYQARRHRRLRRPAGHARTERPGRIHDLGSGETFTEKARTGSALISGNPWCLPALKCTAMKYARKFSGLSPLPQMCRNTAGSGIRCSPHRLPILQKSKPQP